MLSNRSVLITGAATGIGEGIARLFAAQHAQLFLLDRNGERNDALARELGGRAFTCDVRDEAGISRIAAETGPVDVLINNAGIYPRSAFLDTTTAQWDEMQDINLKSVFLLTQAYLPGMILRGAGKVINISSVTFHLGTENMVHYVTSKAGIIGLTRSLAREIGPQNIHVNCITPGAVLVEAEKAVQTEESLRQIVGQQSLKRRIVPLDIARVCLFLATELSDGMTGQTLNVDGGWYMH